MAKVIYNEGVEPLNGTYCGVLYKTLSGGRFRAYLQPMPTEKEAKKNPAARADRIIKLCVIDIQRKMERKAAFEQYRAILQRVQRLYKQLYELEKDNTKLRTMILEAYYNSRRILPSRKVESPAIDFDK